MLTLRITPGSASPIYQQIITQLRHAIATDLLHPGQLLPSVRSLAEQLLINPNTVAKAYADLSRDGLLETLPGRGLAVAPRRQGHGLTPEERLRRLDPLLSQLLADAISLDLGLPEVTALLEGKWKSLNAPAQEPSNGQSSS